MGTTPEAKARQQIDAMLTASGWIFQNCRENGMEVERRLSVVEELESVVSANLQRASRLRQSILQKAFAGALV